MALSDPYASVSEYKTRVDKTATTDDAAIFAQLKSVSRYIDQRCRRADGFNQATAAVTRKYDGNGRSRVWLNDDIATTSGLIVKCDLNGDYDYADADETLAVDTHFWIGPDNAGTTKPFEWLEVAPLPANGVLSVWPAQRRAIEVTALYGWPAVPEAIKELTVALTRYMRDIEESGMTFALQAIDSSIQESREMSFFLSKIERQYARPALT